MPFSTDLGEFDVGDAVRRFKWIDNNSFLIASPWGFEKLFNVTEDSVEEVSSA